MTVFFAVPVRAHEIGAAVGPHDSDPAGWAGMTAGAIALVAYSLVADLERERFWKGTPGTAADQRWAGNSVQRPGCRDSG